MRVLVACERSGVVRDAFRDAGHDAWCCDIEPMIPQNDSPYRTFYNYECDVRTILGCNWDLMIAHPPCTRLANSGVRWLNERDLWCDMRAAALFFKELLNAPIPMKAIENPIPHKYALEIIGRKYDQIIHPWQFGHGETKATCLWLDGLLPLRPTKIVDGREQRVFKMGPLKNRAYLRSITYTGIAKAMAEQWGDLK